MRKKKSIAFNLDYIIDPVTYEKKRVFKVDMGNKTVEEAKRLLAEDTFFGAIEHFVPTPDQINESVKQLQKQLKGQNNMRGESLIGKAALEMAAEGVVPPSATKRRGRVGRDRPVDPCDSEQAFLEDDGGDELVDVLKNCSFPKDAQILAIPHIDYRVLCYFLGVPNPSDVKKSFHKDVTLISFLMMESLPKFMESKGYTKVGELNFDNDGNMVPCGTQTWTIHGEEISFINKGFLYFENKATNDKMVYGTFHDVDHGVGLISAHHTDIAITKKMIAELDEFTKIHNCLSGTKIRDVDMIEGRFSEVNSSPRYTWDNYYFDQSVIDLFDLEVFGFLKNVESYNQVGITKRGIMLHGRPGTGKTTVGHIICNSIAETVIWITPEEVKNNSSRSIFLLYRLADYVTPAVVILEDLDLFAEDREGVTDSLRLGSLMNILDGVNSIKNAVTVATTNRITLIEAALSNRPGRFDRKVLIDSLDDTLRTRMFKDRLTDFEVSDDVMNNIIRHTKSWSGAEIQEFVNTINLYFIRHKEIEGKKITNDIVDDVMDIMHQFDTAPKAGGGAIGLVS